MSLENRPALKNRLRCSVLALLLLGVGFICGWLLSNRLVVTTPDAEIVRGIDAKGDAPDDVRQEVLLALAAFRDGYAHRDINAIDSFMQQLFARTKNVQLLGTDPGEWNRGYDAIAKFIRNDWVNWGDLKLNVEGSAISSAGDAAWLATSGSVKFATVNRPIRFTATLVRSNGRWMFHQVQFQWVERHATLRDLLNPKLLSRLRLR